MSGRLSELCHWSIARSKHSRSSGVMFTDGYPSADRHLGAAALQAGSYVWRSASRRRVCGRDARGTGWLSRHVLDHLWLGLSSYLLRPNVQLDDKFPAFWASLTLTIKLP